MKMLTVLLSVVLCAVASVHAQQVEVVIQNGPIVGKKVVEQYRHLDQFLGIPYAQPPVGELRFRRPVPVESWQQPYHALEWPNNCIQTVPSELVAFHYNKNFTEDCLYLNIWSPDVKVAEDKLRPVLVWIHGGGLIIGSSTFFMYDGRALSAMADAVVVTINYRLSTLGYLYSDEVEGVKGNQGFWDQAMALEWINENIRYFGGDPNQVTIFGESAGSWSVSSHILSPVSRHLFRNAIMMSGAITYGVVDDPQTIVAKQLKGIRAVGCATESDTTINQKVVECLEQLEPEKVDTVYYQSGQVFHSIGVVDGQFWPAHPKQMLSSGDHKKNFNLLASTVEDEGSFMFYFHGREYPKFRRHNPEPITLEEAQEYLYQVATHSFPKHKVSKEAINQIYFNGLNANFDSQNQLRKQTGIGYGDLWLGCPTINFAKSVFHNSPESVKVYQWYYTAKLGNVKMLCSEWGGACHCDDLYPIWGEPFRNRHLYLNRERDISREVINFVKHFIRSGTPGDDQNEWQSYFIGADGKSVVAPYYELGNHPKSHHSFQLDLKKTECHLWNQYYD